MNKTQLEARIAALDDEAEKALKAHAEGRLETKQFNGVALKITEEANTLRRTLNNLEEATKAFAAAEAAASGDSVEFGNKALGGGGVPGYFDADRSTPMQITDGQLQALEMAMQTGTPMNFALGQKGVGATQAWMSSVRMKSPVTEGGITGSPFAGNLPPVQTPYAVGLPYEPTRISTWLPGAAMPGPSAVWMQHVSNAQEVSGVAEGAAKPDIQPALAEFQVTPQKIAGTFELTLEAWQDTEGYGQSSLRAFLPMELTRSYINKESLYLLCATTAASNPISGGPVNATFNGLLNTSGTLTRAVGSDTPIDALQKAAIDLRTSTGAFAEPDLLIINPATMGAIRRSKDSQGRYVMDLLSGPLALTADGSPRSNTADAFNKFSVIQQGSGTSYGNIWGIPIVETTMCPAGQAAMLSIRAGAGIFWTRLAMMMQFNPGYSDTMWENNLMGWRVEARVALSVPRPGAINLISGLPTS